MSLYTFVPLYYERLWGGRKLEKIYQRQLPADKAIGESWELVDRPEAISKLTIPVGPIQDLHDLWVTKRKEVFGRCAPETERFPILLKLIDATEKLSVQVHPPEKIAQKFQGESKTELWYFLQVEENASVYVGLKKGITKSAFSAAIGTSSLEPYLHSLKPQTSDVMFLPSGRIHSIGGGNVIFEIQQNSDTTYRVDDWGRLDSHGLRRQLHPEESLASIDFTDIEPSLAQPHGERVLDCPYFSVQRTFIFPGEFRTWNVDGSSFQYHFVAQGELVMEEKNYKVGEALLISADHPSYEMVSGEEGVEIVTVQFGKV